MHVGIEPLEHTYPFLRHINFVSQLDQPMLDLLWHVYFRWRLRPQQITGDTKYGTIEIIKAVEDARIRAYVPLPDWEHMTPYYGSAQFTYDTANDVYLCPPSGKCYAPFAEQTVVSK